MSYTRKIPCRGWEVAVDTPKLCLSFPSPVHQDREPPYLCPPVVLLGDGLVPLLASRVPAQGQRVSATTHGMSLAGLSPYLGWGKWDSNPPAPKFLPSRIQSRHSPDLYPHLDPIHFDGLHFEVDT